MKTSRWLDVAYGSVAVVALLGVYSVVHRLNAQPTDSPLIATRTLANAASLARGGHSRGGSVASPRIVVFTDFQCPFCKRFDAVAEQLLARHPHEVSIQYRHMPLSIHPLAADAAAAAECAADQGRFPEYAHELFAWQDSLARTSWTNLAVLSGVSDTTRFTRCLVEGDAMQRVLRDQASGDSLHLPGTPAVLIGNRLFMGTVPLDTVERLLRLNETK